MQNDGPKLKWQNNDKQNDRQNWNDKTNNNKFDKKNTN